MVHCGPCPRSRGTGNNRTCFVPDVSSSLASSDWRLVFIGFDNVLGIDCLLDDCLDRVTDFFYVYSVLAKP